jgi:cellulose biosynthesis protein BcsQ
LLRREPKIDGGAKQLLRGDLPLGETIVATDHPRLDLIPADISYRRMDAQLRKYNDPATRLLKLMRPLQRRYACLILDCPAGMSLVAENVIHGSDALLVPVLPSPLSARMLEQLFEFVAARKWTDVQVLPFFSMVDRRRSLHRETIASLRARFPSILATEVPYGSEFERVAARRAPVESYAPANSAAAVYRSLWREVDERLNAVAGARERRDASIESVTGDVSAEPQPAENVVADTDLVGRPWSAGRA